MRSACVYCYSSVVLILCLNASLLYPSILFLCWNAVENEEMMLGQDADNMWLAACYDGLHIILFLSVPFENILVQKWQFLYDGLVQSGP